MIRCLIVFILVGFLIIVGGCGPLVAPMPDRLDEKLQKRVDESWDAMLSPVNRVDHQVLLDVLVGRGAFECGVDKLYFRSEKRFSGGRVIMEVHFDRALPAEDRFEVKVVAPDGAVLRKEAYNREEVEATMRNLCPPRTPNKEAAEPRELAEKRAQYEARWAKIREVYPVDKDAKSN